MIGFWAAFEDARLSASGAQGEEGEEVGGAEEEQRRSSGGAEEEHFGQGVLAGAGGAHGRKLWAEDGKVGLTRRNATYWQRTGCMHT